jgi:hypothetical protein
MPLDESSSHYCIAIIGDVVQSRQIEDRPAAQESLRYFLGYLNTAYSADLLAPFRISRGDEVQALFRSAHSIPDLLWEPLVHFSHSIRFGIGLGELTTGLNADPRQTDGPAWWNARSALQNSVQTKRTGGVFMGFGDRDDIIFTAFATLLQHLRSQLTSRQLVVVSHLRSGEDMVGVAKRLRITKQAVSNIASAAGWRAYQEGESAWRRLLSDHDYSEQWTNAGV